MMNKSILLGTLISLFLFTGCPKEEEKQNLDWSVSEDGSTVSGILYDCDCNYAEIEMLITDENTGENYISTFSITVDKIFERPVGVQSDWLSINLQVIGVH